MNSLFHSEVKDVFLGKIDEKNLRERLSGDVLSRVENDGSWSYMEGEEARNEFTRLSTFLPSSDVAEIYGTVASSGIAQGVVRVVPHYASASALLMKDGDILVTSMTRPEFVPLMRKAGAIVTNEGGISCHAAIVSRELKKPCIIGTKIATQVLKDGDLVEVDAENGVVRILESQSSQRFHPEEYARMFAAPSFALLFSDIFLSSSYGEMGVLSVQDENQWMSFMPKETQEKTEAMGKELYETRELCDEYQECFAHYREETSQLFEKVLAQDQITVDDIKILMQQASRHFDFYQKTEFFYTDKVDHQKMVLSIKEFDELKLGGRAFLNKLLFEDTGYLKTLIQKISLQKEIEASELFMYTIEELLQFVDRDVRVEDEELLERKKGFIFCKKDVLTGEDVRVNIHALFESYKEKADVIEGVIASPGMVTARARVLISDFSDFDKVALEVAKMEEGEVLVAETTSPEIILACKKASAIVTNQGGMLSHAAIVSRELGIPCVIGTKKDVLLNIKTGDLVEVDAENGKVTILKRNP